MSDIPPENPPSKVEDAKPSPQPDGKDAAAPGATPAKPDTVSPLKAGPDIGVETRAKFDRVKADSINVIGQQNVTRQETKNIFTDGGEIFTAKTFSVSMADAITSSEEHEQTSRILHDPEVVDRFAARLLSRRLLVITADPDSGKGAAALRLAGEIRKRDPKVQREMLRVQPLDSTVRIDFSDIAQNEKEFGQRILLFKDVLSRQNRDLRLFLANLDENSADSLRRRLESSQSYLLMTADTHYLLGWETRLTSLQICAVLPHLPEKTLSAGLDQILASAGHTEAVSDELRREILALARSMPRISRFARDYRVTLSKGIAAVRESFAKIDNISLWFYGDLPNDFEAWSFAFVLVLSQSASGADRIPWSEFQELYRELLPSIRRWTGKPEQFKAYRKERVSDEAILNKTQSVIERDVVTGRDVLRFRETTYVDRLWSKILAHSKGLLLSLLPSLEDLAQSKNLPLRVRAAQIVGRIGEIDPAAITLPLTYRMAASSEQSIQAAVGHLFHGILSSSDSVYKNTCLAEVEAMAKSDDKRRVWCAIATYKQIGIVDLGLALGKLKMIAEEKLATKILATNDIMRTLRRIEQDFESANTKEKAVGLLLAHELLNQLSLAIVEDNFDILFAVQYAIVSLCIALDPIQVFNELRSWMFEKNEGLRSLTCLIYLASNGIAEALRERPAIAEDETVTPPRKTKSNLIVVAMASDTDAPERVADFLKSIFVSFNSFFPLELARVLRKSFLAHLSSWAESAVNFPKGLKATEDLYVCLVTGNIPELKKDILEMLSYEEIFTKEKSSLKKFAGTVVSRSLLERGTAFQPQRLSGLAAAAGPST